MVLGGMCIGLCMVMSWRVGVIYGAGWNVHWAVYGYIVAVYWTVYCRGRLVMALYVRDVSVVINAYTEMPL